MLLDHALLPSVLLAASAAPGSVAAPGWILPTAAASTVAIPGLLLTVLKGAKDDQREWSTSAPPVMESHVTHRPESVFVDDAGEKGLGLFATEEIPRGTFLFDYSGEIISEKEYRRRFPSGVSDYVAGLRSPSTGTLSFVDGTDAQLGYPSRYMNHASQPNANVGRRTFCEVGPTGVEECRILMYALRDLRPGDELVWDYGKGYWDARSAPVLP